MLFLNFAHPLTDDHLARIAELIGRRVDRMIAIPTYFDQASPFAEQAHALLDTVALNAEQWQTLPLTVKLPGLATIAAIMLAELHD